MTTTLQTPRIPDPSSIRGPRGIKMLINCNLIKHRNLCFVGLSSPDISMAASLLLAAERLLQDMTNLPEAINIEEPDGSLTWKPAVSVM